jgi:hypothetical protein
MSDENKTSDSSKSVNIAVSEMEVEVVKTIKYDGVSYGPRYGKKFVKLPMKFAKKALKTGAAVDPKVKKEKVEIVKLSESSQLEKDLGNQED